MECIAFDHDAESNYLYYLTKAENGVFTVSLEKQDQQLEKEKHDGYRIACEKCDAIIAAMPKTLTRYGKYVYLAKAICDMVAYDDSSLNYYSSRGRGAFEDGRTICTGYADAYSFLCQRAGLFCFNISGNEHAWNGIRLNNELYHCDTTWMDGNGEDYYDVFGHPFSSDESSHAQYMKWFNCITDFYPDMPNLIRNTGSIDWVKELTAPAIK